MTRRVLVCGGTGVFGARLVELLVASTNLDVVIAARGQERATALAQTLAARYGRAVTVHSGDVAALTAPTLEELGIWCVADTAGPFQGTKPRLAEIAIAARCHYVDIADARDFVAGITRLDAAARSANVLVVSGASSTPGLSQAVLDRLLASWRGIDRIEVAISPGNRQPRGLSVTQAVLASAGQPIRIFRNGAWTSVRGMSLLVRRRMPGLGRRWLLLFETPDLDLIPQRFAPRREAIFRAGLELWIFNVGLWALSKLVALRIMPSLVPLARPLRTMSEWFRRLGDNRGGMTVVAMGQNSAGEAVMATWALVAQKDGPNVPVLPALAVIRGLAEERIKARGAMPCAGLLPLADITREFACLRMVTRTIIKPRALMRRALGARFAEMPRPIQEGHEVAESLLLTGRASVEGARTWIGALVARIIGFPVTTSDVPVSVEMQADGDDEIWIRRFGQMRFRSRLLAQPGHGHVLEQFGPLTFVLRLTASAAGLDLAIISARIGPVPLPSWLVPRTAAKERVDAAGRFFFDVPIALPGIGLLVHYRGYLVPGRAGRAGLAATKPNAPPERF
jgi:hypothetical protein